VIGRRRILDQSGLSLVELVVAIAIGSLVMALAFSGSSLSANRRLMGMTRSLASDLRMLEQRARTERTCYRVVFRPSGVNGESYDIDRYDPAQVVQAPPGGGSQCTAGGAWTQYVFRDVPSDTASRRMPRDVDLVSTTFAGNTLEMSPLGNPTAGTVTLRTPSGQTRQIVIEAFGRVRIQ
jgi:prepilin-type N-terminal cleavage/methylation domain-containing protein